MATPIKPSIKAAITNFSVKGLYGIRDVVIPIKDNRIVIVGVNGLGKTTIINLLYFFLSRQWVRLMDYEFAELSITLDAQPVKVSREDIQTALSVSRRGSLRHLRHKLPPSTFAVIEQYPDIILRITSGIHSLSELRDLATRLGVPISFLENIVQTSRHALRDEQGSLFEESDLALPASLRLKTAEQALNEIDAQVLYLPTYRRIEKDLKAIFPQLDKQIKEYNERRTAELSGTMRSYIELVEFGMKDVEDKLRSVFTDLKETERSQLNNLTGQYLREVIRGEADKYDSSMLAELKDEDISTILNRIKETISESDKARLKAVIAKLRTTVSDDTTLTQDKYVAHFFSRLVDIHKSLTNREQSIHHFIKVCEVYLEAKRLNFDNKNYEFSITQTESNRKLELQDLSSGEKQIVSLFSHLYLNEDRKFIVLIDEPELSLSIEWQRKLLPHVLDSGRCLFLGAVTHSPYIFDNVLDPHAMDLRDCIVQRVP